MAKINDGTFVDFKDGDKMTSDAYEQDRRILQVAINDNDSRIATLSTGQNGIAGRVSTLESDNTTNKTKLTTHDTKIVSLETKDVEHDNRLVDLEDSLTGYFEPITFQTLEQQGPTFQDFQLGYLDAKIKIPGINPESFGLDANAVDNYQAMIDTFSFISTMQNGRGKIVFPQGKVFKFTRPIGSLSFSNVIIDLNGSTLDFSGVPSSNTDSWLQTSGTLGTPVSITSDANEDTRIVSCVTSSFTVGDMVKVYSNKVWDSTRTSTRIGEICFVESIQSASQLTLTTPLNDTYKVSDSANIVKITPVENVVLMNGKLIGAAGNNEMRGLRITRGRNCLVHNIRSVGFDVNHIQFTDCVRSTVSNCFFNEANHASMGYGVSFADASQDCVCSNSHFTDVRHSMTTNNNVTTSWGVTRRILFIGNTVSDSAPAIGGIGGDAIDTHAGAEDIFIHNNIVFSASGVGINVEANRASVKGNRIKGTGSLGIQWQPYADGRKSSININGNEITHVGDAVGSDYGIMCQIRVADCKNVIVSNNEVSSQNSCIRLLTSNGWRFKKGSITGNTGEVKVSGYGVDLTNCDSLSVNGNSVEAPNFGIATTDSNNISITGNSVSLTGASGAGHGVRLQGTSKRNVVTGNTVKNNGSIAASSYGVKVEDTATYNGVFNNVTENMPGGAYLLGIGAGNVQANNI